MELAHEAAYAVAVAHGGEIVEQAIGGASLRHVQQARIHPGAPVFVGKSPRYTSKNPALGIDVDLSGHNALQSIFVFEG